MGTPVTPVDEGGKTFTTDNPAFVSVPLDLMTDGGTGPNRRVRVEPGQHGFFSGHEFRTFLEFDMVGGTSIVIKAVVPINIILYGLVTSTLEGELRVETRAAGTEGGTFSTALPIFNRNTMTEVPVPYVNQVTLTTGGTHAGDGTLLDVLLNKTSNNANFSQSVGNVEGDERGVLAGAYYIILTATGQTRGKIAARWEERP